MTQSVDLIKGALRRITAYQPSDQLDALDASDALDTLNDLLDSLSTDKETVFGSNENVFQWIPGQNQYKIGNPLCTDLGLPTFTGTLGIHSNVISSVTNIPPQLVVGATITDSSSVLPADTTVISIGSNYVQLSASATGTPNGASVITWTIPGDFAIARPLRITAGFTRINNLDFTLDVYETQARFTEILYKAQPGPWPVVAWYNNLFPYGILNVYQTPNASASVHLFTDTILGNLTLYSQFNLPQGYTRAIKWLLAKELCAEYGVPISEAIKEHAKESLDMIKALNAKPANVSNLDRMLTRGNRPDGGWITHGGFR